jgi:hypothetical protein
MEAGVLLGSQVSSILCAIYTSGKIKLVEQYLSAAEGLWFVDDLGWVSMGSDVNHVITILEICAARSIERSSRSGLQCHTAKTEAVLFMRRRGHRKQLAPKLPPNIRFGSGVRQLNTQATPWLGVWM